MTRLFQVKVHYKGLLSALQTLHHAGYCHRDVKLENLLLSRSSAAHPEPRVLLADFGLATPVVCDGKPKRLREAVGSSNYIAPEVVAASLTGSSYDGVASDIWSSGIVLYAMGAGRFPFRTADPDCIGYQKFLRGEHRWPEHFSPLLIDLLKRMLSTVNQRCDLKSALAHAWLDT